MEVLSFRQFIDSQPEITVEVMGSLLEHEMLGGYAKGFNKYRVTFQAPKNQRAWKTGDFTQDIVYVVSDSPHRAKRMAEDWLIEKLNPKENDTQSKRVPRDNYLKATKRKHLDLKGRVVGSWRQVVEMLGYAAERRQNTVDFIDEPELEILVDALSGKAKQRLIDSLSEPERKGLRQILKATKQYPEQWASHGTKAAEFARELSKILWPRRDTSPTSGTTATAINSTQSSLRNSIYRHKITLSEVRKAIAGVKSYYDVVKTANRFGIPMTELDGVVQYRYSAQDAIFNDRRKVYADLYKLLHVNSKNKALEDDHNSPYWKQRGRFDWANYATGSVTALGLENLPHYPPGPDANYEEKGEYEHKMVNWLWDLYKEGPPKRQDTQTDRYKEALEEVLMGHIQKKAGPKAKPDDDYEPSNTSQEYDDEIPF